MSDEGSAAGSAGAGAAGDPAKTEPKFTQADLDKIAGDARKDGRTAAERELLKSLGVTDIEAAKAALAAVAAAEEASKTELQKAQDEAHRLRSENEATKAEARTVLALSRVEGALRDAGINTARIPAALRLIDLAGVVVEGTDVKGVPEAVEALKATSPEWFGTSGRSAPDASGERPPAAAVDYRSMTPQERAEALKKYGVRAP